jgi:hypothetical protein
MLTYSRDLDFARREGQLTKATRYWDGGVTVAYVPVAADRRGLFRDGLDFHYVSFSPNRVCVTRLIIIPIFSRRLIAGAILTGLNQQPHRHTRNRHADFTINLEPSGVFQATSLASSGWRALLSHAGSCKSYTNLFSGSSFCLNQIQVCFFKIGMLSAYPGFFDPRGFP